MGRYVTRTWASMRHDRSHAWDRWDMFETCLGHAWNMLGTSLDLGKVLP
jgi:hypothetical protein